jgi:hypothetical protein
VGLVYFRPALCIAPWWSDWREEVRRWRLDSSYAIEVWPPGWRMKLEDRDLEFGPIGAGDTRDDTEG